MKKASAEQLKGTSVDRGDWRPVVDDDDDDVLAAAVVVPEVAASVEVVLSAEVVKSVVEAV